jgi:hypothetical protein
MENELPPDEPLQPDGPTGPDKPLKPPKRRREDPAGQAWHAEARGRWKRAEELAPEAPFEVYDAPALPAWSAPPHVGRDLFGRYLLDRDSGVVHDVQHALESCAIDAIRNGTFYHFESELPADELVDCACMGA